MVIMDIQDPNELAKLKQLEELKKKMLSAILTKEAYERLSLIRSANRKLAGEAELYLMQLYQVGRLNSQVTDEKLKEVLSYLSEKKEFRIKRK